MPQLDTQINNHKDASKKKKNTAYIDIGTYNSVNENTPTIMQKQLVEIQLLEWNQMGNVLLFSKSYLWLQQVL